jgi:hypothetical protein
MQTVSFAIVLLSMKPSDLLAAGSLYGGSDTTAPDLDLSRNRHVLLGVGLHA